MDFIERVMRVMTHLNIGAALGLVAWLLWSGWQVVTGQITPAPRLAEARALMHAAHAGAPVPMPLVPAHADGAARCPCQAPPPAGRTAAVQLTGADL